MQQSRNETVLSRPTHNLPIRSLSSVPTSQKFGVWQKHSDYYYFEDGNIILDVDGTLYKLHRSLLERHSPVFREMFAMPQPEGSTEGSSEENPITISGINAVNFTRLLSLIYPPILASCNITTADDWMSIFDQADRWQMDNLRQHALERLRRIYINPVNKIVFWNRYGLPDHEVISSYSEILSRSEPLSLLEGHALGMTMVVKIAQAREIAHSRGVCACGKNGVGGFSVKADKILDDLVRDVLGLRVPKATTPAMQG